MTSDDAGWAAARKRAGAMGKARGLLEVGLEAGVFKGAARGRVEEVLRVLREVDDS